jgi:predicted kinase
MLLPGDSVVVVAGLPGAGKTTLVAGEPRALDSDALREAWAPRLGRLPYPLWRPLVHAWHWVAIWRAVKRPEGVVVVRPFTHGWLRRAVLRRARRHHRAVHLVVVDATPAQARAGQRARGRTVRERAMRGHERRWASTDLAREPWTTVTRLQRQAPGCSLNVSVSPRLVRSKMRWTSGGALTTTSEKPSRWARSLRSSRELIPFDAKNVHRDRSMTSSS